MSVKEKILNAGMQLLHAEGFTALTQNRIARAAGVSQSHLTYYFPTRAELLVALAEHTVDEALASVAARKGDPLAALLEGVGYLPRVRMLVGLVTAADRDAALRPAFNRLVAHIRESLGGLLQALGYAGSPEQVVALHGAVIGLAVLNLGRQNEESLGDIAAGLETLLHSFPRVAKDRGMPQ